MASAKISSLSDEREWVVQIQTSIEDEIDENDLKTPVSIFCIPPPLMACKPEAYVPQVFAFGPYHHWRPHLYDMERYKLGAARRMQAELMSTKGLKFYQIVEDFKKRVYKIRCNYHKNLDLCAETIAWMMAIDTTFLLEFLDNYTKQQAEDTTTLQEKQPVKSASKRIIESERRKLGFTMMILRDLTMLENQIPLFLLRKLLNLLHPSKQAAEQELSMMLVEFINDVSPFKATGSNSQLIIDNITRHAHLLEILYWTIVPKPKEEVVVVDVIEITEQNDEGELKEVDHGDTSTVRQFCNWIWGLLSTLNVGIIRPVKGLLFSRPIKFIMASPVKKIFSGILPTKPKSDDDDQSSQSDKPPQVEEITIPSVSELASIGVKFLPTETPDITTIKFDTKTVTMYLPLINLDVNTEVVLRNLVAYEVSAVPGPLIFTRYTELMNGIIDTEEDVHILTNRGVIVNRLKSDKEAAELWNGMSRSLRLSKVGFLDKAIRDVNKYYRRSWKVKGNEFMRNYIFGSWKILTFLAAALLLLMTCVQAFCSVYSCSAHLNKWTNVGSEQ